MNHVLWKSASKRKETVCDVSQLCIYKKVDRLVVLFTCLECPWQRYFQDLEIWNNPVVVLSLFPSFSFEPALSEREEPGHGNAKGTRFFLASESEIIIHSSHPTVTLPCA